MLHRRHGDLLHAGSLLAPEQSTPVEGLRYRRDFISRREEEELLRDLSGLDLKPAPYKQYLARRRIASFGHEYDFSSNVLRPGQPMPGFLLPLRTRVAAWVEVEEEAFVHALINEYEEGTPLGWHRDTPEFGMIVGVSLGGTARMRFRRYPPQKREKVFDLDLEPRSAYTLRDEARWGWQHSVAPTPALRYSITFRTLK